MMRSVRAAGKLAAFLMAFLAAACVGSPARAPVHNTPVVLPGGSAYSSSDPLPLAPELSKGVLDNGLTYYVRRNGNPGGRAVMFLIVNSGSSNERDDQLGYAHFVEHMAFNGTESFPENELVRYLRSIGMDFGAEINAHTTREETLYTLQMPLNDPSFFDTGLKVLKEWATKVSFDPVEVEKEKGVIIEEMRLGLGPDETARIGEIKGLLAGTAHEDREPIGTEASIHAATAERLREFYLEHYRPERMAVIVVGDIEPRGVVARIQKEFDFAPLDGGPRARPSFPVAPSIDLGFYSSFSERFERSIVSYRKLVPYVPEKLIGDYERLLRVRLAAEAIRLRLADLTRAGQASWRDAYFDDDYFYGSTRLYSFTLAAGEGAELEAFAGLAAEVERLRRFGFTESEFKRTIDLYRRWLGTLDVEDDDLKSLSFAEEYVRNFMYGEPVPGVVNERVYIKKVLDTMTLAELNAAGAGILAADEGFVSVRARAGSGAAALTEAAFEKALREARRAQLVQLVSSGEEGALFDAPPAAGAIVSERALDGALLELRLSNGARVLLKQTIYDKDSIGFLAWSRGGYTSLPVEYQTMASFAPTLMGAAGLGSMSATRLEEETASINAALSWSIGEQGEVMVGRTSTADLEAFLRLVYLTAAEPGRDARAFNAARDRLAAQVAPYVRDPDYRFESAWSFDLFGHNPRVAPLEAARVAAVDFDRTRQLVVDSLANAADFTYVLVGDFDLERARRLLVGTIGAIPAGAGGAGGRADAGGAVSGGQAGSAGAGAAAGPGDGAAAEPAWVSPLVPDSPGRRVDFNYSREDRASVRLVWSAQAPWSWKREATLGFLAQALNNRLLDALREDLGGTYVVSTRAAFASMPVEQYSLIVQFDTDPSRVEELIAEVQAEVATLVNGSFNPTYVSQIRVAAQRDVDGRAKTNDFWVNRLGNALMTGLDFDVVGRARQGVNLVELKTISALAAELLVPERLFVYTMLPEK